VSQRRGFILFILFRLAEWCKGRASVIHCLAKRIIEEYVVVFSGICGRDECC
jgi:hypothetical protein